MTQDTKAEKPKTKHEEQDEAEKALREDAEQGKPKTFKFPFKKLLFFLNMGVVFAAWRFALWLAAFMGQHRLRLGSDPSYVWIPQDPWVPIHLPEWLQFFTRWDAGWYLSIVENGYLHDVGAQYSNLVFFPLYPLLSRAFASVFSVDPVIALFVVANLATFVGLFLLWKLARQDMDIAGSWRAVLLLLLFPTSIFFGSAYTEGLFLVLSVASFLLARKKKWWFAGGLGLLATLTRPAGLFLFPALVVEYFEQRKWNGRKVKWDVFATLIPPLGIAVYMGYLWKVFGNPLMFLAGQSEWSRSTTFSIAQFTTKFSEHWGEMFSYQGDNLAYVISNSSDLLFLLFGLVMGVLVLVRYRVSYGVYILVTVLVTSFTGSFHSIPRFLLVLFPIVFFFARLGKKHQGVYSAYLVVSAVLFAIFSMMVANLWWVA